MRKITRRRFLGLGALALPAALGADARFVEPTALRVIRFDTGAAGNCRFIHFTDFHHKGNVDYATKVVRTINNLAPEFVCFTGDLVEDVRFAPAAFDFIRQIDSPVYGCPGNHEYTSGISFAELERVFAATGGAWLADRSAVLPKHDLEIIGMGLRGARTFTAPLANRRLALMHYPQMSEWLDEHRYDLILAGHSHGGQVRLPFYGGVWLPDGVGRYQLGYYQSPAGPLYVNAGIGTYHFPLRWNCPPEITVVTM